MGDHLDAQEDSLALSRFYGEFAAECLAVDGRLDAGRADELSRRLHERVTEHLEGVAVGGEDLRRFGYRSSGLG